MCNLCIKILSPTRTLSLCATCSIYQKMLQTEVIEIKKKLLKYLGIIIRFHKYMFDPSKECLYNLYMCEFVDIYS